ncbi:MAG: cytochrome c [Chloroflexi bacterium]|nr:cytochrome c [Chloroflexota bacterium]
MGRQVYQAACASCHGATGKGDGPAVAGLAWKPIDISKPYMADIRDGEVFAIIGGTGCPPSKECCRRMDGGTSSTTSARCRGKAIDPRRVRIQNSDQYQNKKRGHSGYYALFFNR